MVSVVSYVIDRIAYVLQLIRLVNVVPVHDFHQLHKYRAEVGIQHLDALRADLLRVDEKVLESADYQVANELVLVAMLNALIYEGLQVLLILENELRDELGKLVEDKGNCLSHSRHWIVD